MVWDKDQVRGNLEKGEQQQKEQCRKQRSDRPYTHMHQAISFSSQAHPESEAPNIVVATLYPSIFSQRVQ